MIGILKSVVAFLMMILVSIATYWVVWVTKTVDDLSAKDRYLHGTLIVPTTTKP